jgi:hypothetical protein
MSPQSGDAILLELLAGVSGTRYLDGMTGAGRVDLAPNTGILYSGLRSAVGDGGGGTIVLECRSVSPRNRDLNGLTV